MLCSWPGANQPTGPGLAMLAGGPLRVSIEWPQVVEAVSGYRPAVRSVTPAAGHGGEQKIMKTAGRSTDTGLNKFQVTRWGSRG
ncbi:hypothetical protein AAC387_Pa09g0828 [Persea americana]